MFLFIYTEIFFNDQYFVFILTKNVIKLFSFMKIFSKTSKACVRRKQFRSRYH